MTLDYLICKHHYETSEQKKEIDEFLKENKGWFEGFNSDKCDDLGEQLVGKEKECGKVGYIILKYKQFDSESDEITLVDAIRYGDA